MKKNLQPTKSYLIGLITIFSFIVLCVEVLKRVLFNQESLLENFDHGSVSTYVFALPVISIGVLFLMAAPKHQIYKLGYYATTLGLIIINRLK